MADDTEKILFTEWDRGSWLRKIEEIYLYYAGDLTPRTIVFSFADNFDRDKIEPIHLVTYACLIHYLKDKGHVVAQDRENKAMYDYIFNKLNFSAYWKGEKNHVEANGFDSIFNLWRIVESEKDLYAKKVEEYFKLHYFNDKDLSAISISLVEAYYNVFDHADADGNAFSIIFYDEETHTLSYAIADFGKGIPTSVRQFDSEVGTDVDALKWAMTDNATVRSTKRNRGFGMSNILASAKEARVFSNNALALKRDDKYKYISIDEFAFPGTLIYLSIDISSLEDEDVYETFTL